MEAPFRKCLVLSIFVVAASSTSFPALAASATSFPALAASATSFPALPASSAFKTFLYDLNLQCPLSIPLYSSPILVDGASFEEILNSSKEKEYIAVLFYASWCPFSKVFQSQFSTLNSLYPQIKHLMVEQSSALPSVFSRYGIHSVPSLIMVHRTIQTRFHGRNNLSSVIDFYKRTTGLKPLVNMIEAESCNSEYYPNAFRLWNRVSLKEAYLKEPYLLFAIIFVLSRAFLYYFPGIAFCFTTLRIAFVTHLNLEIFGDSRQLLGRIIHLIDVKRILSKLNLCKTRNFREGARNAQVWTSSLSSVSLGETFSSGIFPSSNL